MTSSDDQLLADFVATFQKFDDSLWERDRIVPDFMLVERDPEDGTQEWKPAKVATERSELAELYQRIPAPFSPLYERLVLTYRWYQVMLPTFTLLANPPGPIAEGLAAEIFVDYTFVQLLIPQGYIPFAKGPDYNYDPVCFAMGTRLADGEFPIVQFDHEDILCNLRLGDRVVLAPTFRALIEQIVNWRGPV